MKNVPIENPFGIAIGVGIGIDACSIFQDHTSRRQFDTDSDGDTDTDEFRNLLVEPLPAGKAVVIAMNFSALIAPGEFKRPVGQPVWKLGNA